MTCLESLRAGYGLCQLVKPDFIATTILGHRLDGRSATVVRILGARHLVQSAVISLAPRSVFLHRGGAAVDMLHAATMVILALTDGRRRKAALADAAAAGIFAAAELLVSASQRHQEQPSRGRNSR